MSRGWKWGLSIGGGLLLAFGFVLWDAHRRAGTALERHARKAAGTIAEVRARNSRRPPLFGGARPGNAWDAYREVFDRFLEPREEDPQEEFYPRSLKGFSPEARLEDDAALDRLLAGWAGELGRLVQAVDAAEVTGDPREPRWFLRQADRATACLGSFAGRLHERGEDRRAMELLLVGVGTAADIARQGDLDAREVLCTSEAVAAYAAREILSGHALGAADLAWLAGRLDSLSVRDRPTATRPGSTWPSRAGTSWRGSSG